MANNEHIVKSLFSEPIFSMGYGPTVDTIEDTDVTDPRYNLRYNRTVDLKTYRTPPTPEHPTGEPIGQDIVDEIGYLPVDTLDHNRESTPTDPKPKVNGIMTTLGERIIVSNPLPLATEDDNTVLATEDDNNLYTD